MRIESLPVCLPGRAHRGLLLLIAFVAVALLLLGAAELIGESAATGGDLRLAPFRWDLQAGVA